MGATAAGAAIDAVEIQAGTEIDVRLAGALNSGEAHIEDRFEATTLIDVNVGGRPAVPAGTVMRGVVTDVEPATRTNRTARLTVSFDQVTVAGQAYAMRGTVIQAIEGDGIRGKLAASVPAARSRRPKEDRSICHRGLSFACGSIRRCSSIPPAETRVEDGLSRVLR